MSKEEMTGYSLSRHWFDFCFENPEKIRPIHTAIYMFALEHWNRLGQRKKFNFPSQMTMDAIGVKSYNTYIPAFNDLIEWGFFDLIEKSKNQYSSNIIALSNIDKAPDKALDKALIKHSTKQVQSNQQSTCSINKQINNRTNKQLNHEQGENSEFSLNEVFSKPDSIIHSSRLSVKESDSGELVNGVLIPEPLQDVENIGEAYAYYCQYMKENFSRWPTSTTTQMDLQKLVELQAEGNDPVEVIKQTIHAKNKSFYPLRDDFNSSAGDRKSKFSQFLSKKGGVV